VLRQVIGLIALYIGFIAATGMGAAGGQHHPAGVPTGRRMRASTGSSACCSSRLLGIDGAAQLAHRQIQIEAIVETG
jgi:hypothetical protein